MVQASYILSTRDCDHSSVLKCSLPKLIDTFSTHAHCHEVNADALNAVSVFYFCFFTTEGTALNLCICHWFAAEVNIWLKPLSRQDAAMPLPCSLHEWFGLRSWGRCNDHMDSDFTTPVLFLCPCWSWSCR